MQKFVWHYTQSSLEETLNNLFHQGWTIVEGSIGCGETKEKGSYFWAVVKKDLEKKPILERKQDSRQDDHMSKFKNTA